MKKLKLLLYPLPTLVLLSTMFVSSTFAWFTDFAVNSGNRVQSGNLAVEFTASETIGDNDLTGLLINLKTSTDPLFNLPDPAQPGDQQSFYLRVKSTGSIAIKYQIDFVVIDTSILAEVIMFDINRVIPTPATSIDTVPGTLIEDKDLINFNDLEENEFEIWLVTMRYDSSADNTYNYASLDFEVDITLNAWQASNDAPQPSMVRTFSELQAAVNDDVENIRLFNSISAPSGDLVIDYLLTLDLGGFTLTLDEFSLTSSQYGAFEIGNGSLTVNTFTVNTPNAYFNDPLLILTASSESISTLNDIPA